MRRWWAVGLAGLVTTLALAGCGGNPAGVDGNLTDDWRPLSEPKPFVPESGVCHSSAVESGYLAAYAPVDCATTHLTETVHVGTFTAAAASGTKPPATGSKQYQGAFGACGTKADALIGGDWRTGRLALNLVLPSPEAWQGGARWYRCDLAETHSLDDPNMSSRDGSLKGALAKVRFGCFTPRIKDDIVQEMVAIACTKAHRSEFVGIYTAPNVAYRDFLGDTEAIHKACLNTVAAYAKVPKDGDLAFRSGTIYYYPSAPEWDQGNRGVKCFSWDSGRTFTRSIKNGGPSLLPVN